MHNVRKSSGALVDVAATLRIAGQEDRAVVARLSPELVRRCGAKEVE